MQRKKGDKYFLWLLQIDNYLISISKTKHRDKYKNQKQYTYNAKNSHYIWTKPIEKMTSISSQKSSLLCIPIICYFKTQ